MKIGYLDCFSGISGNMCLGALVDAGVPVEALRESLGALPLGGYSVSAERVRRGGLAATLVEVELDEGLDQPHRGLSDVVEIIRGGSLPERVVERSCAVFRALAEAEAAVHDTDVESVHFHEVGAVDAICDIVGAVVGIEYLGLEEVRFGTVMLGGGTVEAAHGTLPVPAPATAELLRGLPAAGGPVQAELTTPTGAAILKALGTPSPAWPAMSIREVAYGAGSRRFEGHPNLLRLAVGEAPAAAEETSDFVWVLETNLDDMTGEEVGYCIEQLLKGGALDAFAAPVQMKKARPGLLLTALAAPADADAVQELLWKHTSTLGIRRHLCRRAKLCRDSVRVETPWGEVRVKTAYLGERLVRCAPEYEDCRRLAEGHDVPLRTVYRAAQEAAPRPECG